MQQNIYEPNKYAGDRTILRNVLDLYDNVSYTFTLYMIRDFTDDGGGFLRGAYTASPSETVILAQTGVTEASIKDVSINIVRGTAAGQSFTSRVDIEIEQPGAADFLDQIQYAKQYLGIQAGVQADVPMFLELNFKGYTADPDDEDAGGEPTTIAGPYRYRLNLFRTDINISERGSTYSMFFGSLDNHAYTDTVYLLPKAVTTRGATVEEHLKSLENELREYREKTFTDHLVQDTLDFDVNGLIESLNNNTKLNFDEADSATNLNRLINAESQGLTREEYDAKESSLDGDFSVVADKRELKFGEGTSLELVVFTLLSMNSEFLKRCVRTDDLGDPKDRIDRRKKYKFWVRLNGDVEFGDYDNNRKMYSRKVTYKPELYKTVHPNLVSTTADNEADRESATQGFRDIVAEGAIKKSYSYIFTGLNDQIKSMDIKYDNGHLLLQAPLGGLTGSVQTLPRAPGKTVVEPNEDLTGTTQEQAQRLNSISDFIDALGESLSDGGLTGNRLLDDVISSLAPDQVKRLLESEQTARQVAQALADFTVPEDEQTSSNAPVDDGAEDEQEQNSFTNYTSGASGFVFGVDLVNNSDLVYASRLQQANQAVSEILEPTSRNTNAAQQPRNTNISGTGGRKATLFSYLYQNMKEPGMLLKLDMNIRGDPWFLGKPGNTDNSVNGSDLGDPVTTDNDGIVYKYNDNYFLFEMQSPRRFDQDVDDEDLNTGLWTPQGTAFFISGLYQFYKLEAIFRSGEFSMDLTGIRVTSIPLSLVSTVTDSSGNAADAVPGVSTPGEDTAAPDAAPGIDPDLGFDPTFGQGGLFA